ncbi:hypothetical protein ABH945_002793 [Paraburkholderia sp. GAS333]|uniref:hypothetical protein n=1 Tax=Paraburkholderia sp. GAS333 TaxID=3156279 RepID=UPI003D19F565
MKVDKKEQDFGADSAQSTQLCGLNRRQGVFSYTLPLGSKQPAARAVRGAVNRCQPTQIASPNAMPSAVAPF